MDKPLENRGGLLSRLPSHVRNELGLLIAIIAVVGLTIMMNDSYLQKPGENAAEILRYASLLGIFALGAAVVIISGGIDLSSGSVIAFSGMICTAIMLKLCPQVDDKPVTTDLPLWILLAGILGTMFVGFLIGSFHAWLITVIGLPPFVATLASLVGLRSLAKVLVQDINGWVWDQPSVTQININDETFGKWGQVWWIPLPIFLILCVLTWIVLNRTVIGRHLYAMGGNEEAARLSGIRTNRLKWIAYCFGSVTAAIAGILYTSVIGMSDPATQGLGYELEAIAAAVVGGCSLAGGIGTVTGTLLGALFLRVVIESVSKVVDARPDDFQGLIVGMMVVLAVAFNELRGKGGMKKQFFPGALGWVNVGVLTALAFTITAVMSEDYKKYNGIVTASAVCFLLVIKAGQERGYWQNLKDGWQKRKQP